MMKNDDFLPPTHPLRVMREKRQRRNVAQALIGSAVLVIGGGLFAKREIERAEERQADEAIAKQWADLRTMPLNTAAPKNVQPAATVQTAPAARGAKPADVTRRNLFTTKPGG